jgi:hypothetical protein
MGASCSKKYYFLGCDTAESDISLPTFRRNVLSSFSKSKSKLSKQLKFCLFPASTAHLFGLFFDPGAGVAQSV